MHRNKNPCYSFFMVNIDRGMDRRCVRPTTTTTSSRNLAAILVYSVRLWYWHLCYDQLTPVKNKAFADQYHTLGSKRRAYLGHNYFFKFDCWPRPICCDKGQVVWNWVDSGVKVNRRSINLTSIQVFFTQCLRVRAPGIVWDYWKSNRRRKI